MSNRHPIHLVLTMKVYFLMLIQLTDLANGAETSRSHLSIARIFSGKEFTPQNPGVVVWCPRSTDAYLTLIPATSSAQRAQTASENFSGEASPAEKPPYQLVARIDLTDQSSTELVNLKELTPTNADKPLEIDSFQVSEDESKLLLMTNSQRVWRKNTRGDFWVFDLVKRKLSRLGGDAKAATLQFVKFSPSNTQVAFVRENNLYVQQLDDLQIQQLTTDGSTTCINGTGDWVNEEELGIRDGFRWSPDGKSIAFWQFDTSGVSEFHLIDNTSDRYPRLTTFAYPKVGQVNSATRIGVVSSAGGPVRWMSIAGDPREHYLASMQWAPAGNQLLIQQFTRLQNINRVLLADALSGTTRTVFTEEDTTWVDFDGPVTWIDDGKSFLWLSERDGWRHAYLASIDGSSCNLITPGNFDVLDIEGFDEKKRLVYFSASPETPTQRYLYRLRLDGSPAERLSPMVLPGWHLYGFSPNTHWAVHSYSNFTTPPVTAVVQMPDHVQVRLLADNAAMLATLEKLHKPATGFLQVPVGDGTMLDGWFIHPPDLDRTKNHPLFLYVYGEPAGQTVRDAWSGPGQLWHWMLAQSGYLVASIDCRGTRTPRGRAWRKSVYGKIGVLPPADHAAATQALLQKWSFADPKRVGVWGWSGGGSNTLHLIFRYPDLFNTAIAVAPNADQLLYDSIYQERYMGSPIENAEAYRQGSPLTHAANLRGNLLLIHGTGDDNCHYQGTEKLMNELIRMNKDFRVMPYPMRTHAISEGDNTVAHLYGLMTKYLNEHLSAP